MVQLWMKNNFSNKCKYKIIYFRDCVYTGPPTTTIKPEPKPIKRWPNCVLKDGYMFPEDWDLYNYIIECKPNEYCEDFMPKKYPSSGYLG